MEEIKKDDSNFNQIIVKILNNDMSACMYLKPPIDDKEYSLEDLKEALRKEGVVEGIQEKELRDILQYKKFDRDVIVAKGKQPINGKDGYFEVPLQMEAQESLKPKILEDGSVDYSCFSDPCMVYKEEEVARYIPPTLAVNGITVKGQILIGKNGRDQKPLKGKGFLLSEDSKIYTAEIDGRLEYEQGKRLNICNLFEVKSDVTVVTGNIDFSGDVYIRGNVNTGMEVKAAGDITVDGYVEGARLLSGKNIVLKNGMQGGGKGYLEAEGDISGKFFEQTTIRAKGNVKANAIMNCDVEAEDSVLISGKYGILVGGTVLSFFKVEATMIGNLAERRTFIKVGSKREIHKLFMKMDKEIETLRQELQKVTDALSQLELVLKSGANEEITKKKMKLLRYKITRDTELTHLKEEHQKMSGMIERSKRACVVVHKSIYRGVVININDTEKIINSENYNVTYQMKNNEIEVITNI